MNSKSLAGVATAFPGDSSFESVEWLASALLWPTLESLMVVDEHRNNRVLQ
ncbi:hypothetical protein LC607_15915 [Nostoc sp. CHAB 5824]|nr:hypothetical protein [Nostoc sp. CHAB 5824]